MYDHTTGLNTSENAWNRLRRQYYLWKDEYLNLCGHYNLPPRDLSLSLIGDRNLDAEDRSRLIRLVIILMELEKVLGPDGLEDLLFAGDESEYLQSGIFKYDLH